MNSTRSTRFSVAHPCSIEPHDYWKAAAAHIFFSGLEDDSIWPGQELYDMLLETDNDDEAREVLVEETDAELRSHLAGLTLEAAIDRMQDMAIELQTAHEDIQESWESQIDDAWLAIAARHVLKGLPQAVPLMGEDGPVLDEDDAVGQANRQAAAMLLELVQAENQTGKRVDQGVQMQAVLERHGLSVRPEHDDQSPAALSAAVGRIIQIAHGLHAVHCDLVPLLHRHSEEDGGEDGEVFREIPI